MHVQYTMHVKYLQKMFFAQLAGAVEYTNCTSAEGYPPPPDECPDYDKW